MKRTLLPAIVALAILSAPALAQTILCPPAGARATLICAKGAPAKFAAPVLSCEGGARITLVCGGGQVPVLASAPAPGPAASGPILTAPEGALWPAPPAKPWQATGEAGAAIPLISNATLAPLGMLLHFVDQKSTPTANELVISTAPNSFTPAAQWCSTVASAVGTLVVRFGKGSVTALNKDCALQPNRTYYLNLRDGATPRGTVSTQLWWQRRTDQ